MHKCMRNCWNLPLSHRLRTLLGPEHIEGELLHHVGERIGLASHDIRSAKGAAAKDLDDSICKNSARTRESTTCESKMRER